MTGIGALLALAFAGACGPAVRGQEARAEGFARVDANHDGVIDRDEWEQFSSRLFEGIDRDGDGQASAEELGQSFVTFDYNQDDVIEGHEAPLIIILGDADGDGRVSRDEFAIIDWNRGSIDTDRNGALSREEFARAQRRIYDQADFDRSTTLGRSEFEAAPSFTLFRF